MINWNPDREPSPVRTLSHYKKIPNINPIIMQMVEAFPLQRVFAFGIRSSHTIYNIVPPAKERHREMYKSETLPKYAPKNVPNPVGSPATMVKNSIFKLDTLDNLKGMAIAKPSGKL